MNQENDYIKERRKKSLDKNVIVAKEGKENQSIRQSIIMP